MANASLGSDVNCKGKVPRHDSSKTKNPGLDEIETPETATRSSKLFGPSAEDPESNSPSLEDNARTNPAVENNLFPFAQLPAVHVELCCVAMYPEAGSARFAKREVVTATRDEICFMTWCTMVDAVLPATKIGLAWSGRQNSCS